MSALPKPEHLHTYERVRHPKRRDLYMCRDPHCSHRINKMFLLGKAALCPYCHREYVITKRMLDKLKLLHCKDCTRHGKSPEALVMDSLEAKLAKQLGENS